MRIYLLFQEHSYAHESLSGYIWAPVKHFSDIGKYNWENVKRLQKGDVIYSVTQDKIVSVNIATSSAVSKKKPTDLDIPAAGDGWYITANYSPLRRPIPLQKTHKIDIARLSVEREIPFDEDGNQIEGKIFEIPYETHKYMMGLVSLYNFNNFDLPELSERDVATVHQIEHLMEKYDTKEHKNLAIRMGILETELKQKLLRHTRKCAICDINYEEFIAPAYIKSWEFASTSERLDINNLVMMCPLHRDMFEKGLITFNDKGMIKMSSLIRFENFKSLSINLFTSIDMTKEQIDYMDWHSKNVFKE